MRVLDVGCGAGDVSFLAARLVGPSGSVTGVDQAPEAVELARQRASEAALTNIGFVVGDAESLTLDPPVDAVIGRLVLMYSPDPASLLRRLRGLLAPGGVVAFHEMDLMATVSEPRCALLDTTMERIRETFRRVGVSVRPGLELYRAFQDAGLPAPQMIQNARVEGGAESAAYEQIAGIVRTLLPLMQRTGVATPADVDLDTLADRIRAEVVTARAVIVAPPLIGAWATDR